MKLETNTQFDTILFDAFVVVVSEMSHVEENEVQSYLEDRINQDLEANGGGWEYGLIYLKTLFNVVKEDANNIDEDEDPNAMLIYNAFQLLMENNDPELFISIQGW